jgi:hypothetical protein
MTAEPSTAEEGVLLGSVKSVNINICRTYTRELAIQITVDDFRLKLDSHEDHILRPLQPVASKGVPSKKGLISCLIDIATDRSVECVVRADNQSVAIVNGVFDRLRRLASLPALKGTAVEQIVHINISIEDSCVSLHGPHSARLESSRTLL